MKKILVFVCVLLFMTHADAQQAPASVQVPTEVAASLKKMFPEASGVEWNLKKEKYKAEFKVSKTKHEVWLDKAGAVSKHRYEIKKDALPKAVTDAIAKEFATYTIHDCERTDDKGVATYKVELKSSADKKKVVYSGEGKVIPKNDD